MKFKPYKKEDEEKKITEEERVNKIFLDGILKRMNQDRYT